jgi:four helix bundle protein
MRNFRQYEVWKDSIELIKRVYRLSSQFPESEKYALLTQVRRAAISIASNIAEGASRRTELDFSRFLIMSIGSSFELETQLIIANKLDYICEDEFNEMIHELNVLQKRINQFISTLK